MSLKINLAGEPVFLRPAGTLWIPQYSTLVVSDLHLEKGSSYALRGQLLPPYDTRDTLERLEAEITANRPDRLVLLGDSLHDMDAINRMSEADANKIRNLTKSVDLIWIYGNHDLDGGETLGGLSQETLRLGSFNFCHEPRKGHPLGEIAGHLHPCAQIYGVAGKIRRKCFISDNRRIIMPAFGSYTGGINVRDKAFDNLFEKNISIYLLGKTISRLNINQATSNRIINSQLK